ncbi:hypothetical protein BD779DRAFT_1630350 [Infundibulicybe gibba]|nr:hypothetical protein BD779DRAFT_1630350 [Infundibulicybe gibba]
MLNGVSSRTHYIDGFHQTALVKGWEKIKAYADKKWGTEKRQIVTNTDDYLESPATVCPADKVVNIELTGEPNCVESKLDTEGEMNSTNGTLRLTFEQGYDVSAEWVVTRESSFQESVRISATFHIPEIVDIGGAVTGTTTITNELTSSFRTTISNMMAQELRMHSPKGKKCYVKMDTKVCNIFGKGRLRQTASGYVWFMYKASPSGRSRRGAVHIDEVLSVDERSSYLEFAGSMKAQVRTEYEAICT